MKKIIALLFAVCIVFSLCACGSSSGPASPAPDAPSANADSGGKLTFTTGGSAGTYYAYGSVLAQYVSTNSNLDVTAITGNGSQSNVNDLDAKAVDLAFCQSDVMSYAYSGTNLFAESGAITSFSVVADLYLEQVQIVTTNPDIKTVDDLKGKIVSIGAIGSGVYFNALDVLGVYGITVDDITPVYQSFGDSAESLKDGKIDVGFIVAGAPTTAITDLATSKSVYLVSLDDEHIAELLKISPYYSEYTISADTYGLAADAKTVAVGAVLLARDDVSEDDIYTFVSTIFENAAAIAEQHGKGADLDLSFASSITDVPYHPGAAKYFAEKGITVNSK